MFLGGAAQAADTNVQETTVAVTEKSATTTEEKVFLQILQRISASSGHLGNHDHVEENRP